MAEIGIDVPNHRSKAIDDFDVAGFNLVVTLCGEESCTVLPPDVESCTGRLLTRAAKIRPSARTK